MVVANCPITTSPQLLTMPHKHKHKHDLAHILAMKPEVIDIDTLNAIIKLLDEEILKYKPESNASIALMVFMQRLSE
jgi:hypothetical protein